MIRLVSEEIIFTHSKSVIVRSSLMGRRKIMKLLLKKWKWILVCLSAIICAFVTFEFVSQNNQTRIVKHIPDDSTIKIVGDYLKISDLMKAPYILEGTVTHITQPFDYGGIPFVKITFQISDTLYAQSKLDQTVTLLREQEMFTPLKKDHQYILYLYDYEGPIASNVKMICGGNLGAYEIVQGEAHSSLKTVEDYKRDIKNALQ